MASCYTQRFSPEADIKRQLTYKNVLQLLLEWGCVKPQHDIFVVRAFEGDETKQFELRFYPLNSGGYQIKCSWWSWHINDDPKKDYPHEFPGGYEINDENLRWSLRGILFNYHKMRFNRGKQYKATEYTVYRFTGEQELKLVEK